MHIFIENIENFTIEDLEMLVSTKRIKSSKKYKNEDDVKRHLLGEAMIQDALIHFGHKEDFKIKKGKDGKPFVDVNNFHFNISHSGSLVALVYDEKPMGIDIEKIVNRDTSLANRFFTNEERDYINNSKNKLESFYKIWTLKESYVKAIGKGLKKDLASFSIVPKDNDFSFYGIEYKPKFDQKSFDGYVLSVTKLYIKD